MMRALASTFLFLLLGGCAPPKVPDPQSCEADAGCLPVPRECLDSSDCAAHPAGPVCDAATGTCRPCAGHRECPSGLCRTSAALPAPVAVGRCVAPELVVIVDGGRCRPSAADGSAERPFCEVQDALAAHAPFVTVRPQERSTPYKAVTITSGRVAIFGPDRDAELQAVLGGVTVSGAATQVVLGDLAVQRDGEVAVTCREAELQLLRTIVAFSRDGVTTSEGCRLTVDRSRFSQNARVALRSAATARHRVTNSLFVQNGRGFDMGDRLNQTDVILDLGSNQQGNLFSFNTVSGNDGFVSCRAGQVLRNSVLAGKSAPLRDQGCALQQVYVGDEDTARLDRQFALTRESHCCVDNALPEGAVSLDYNDSPRPQGGGYDMGCYELR